MNTNATDATGLTHVVPASWQPWIAIAVVAIPIIGRGYHALANGGGLMGAYRGIVFGTNSPAPVKPTENPAKPQ